MGDMLIRNIPAALKVAIECAAKEEGKSLSDRAIDLLRKGILFEKEAASAPSRSAWDVLRPLLYSGDDVEAERFARIMDDIEAERKRDFGRPLPDLE